MRRGRKKAGMIREISEIKTDCREFLMDKYSPFLPLLLVFFILDLAASVLPDLFFSTEGLYNEIARFGTGFILNVLFGMAGVGLIKAALDMLQGIPLKIGTLFYAFQNRSNRFILVQILFTIIKTLLVLPLIPLNEYAVRTEMSTLTYYAFYTGIQLLALFITMLATLRLVWANYFMLEDPLLDAAPALKKSLAFSRGKTLQILYLKLSFAGLYLLSYCSMLIGFLYVRPYAEVSYAKYYLSNR